MISDDEYLERVVAGIQTVTAEGATVTWNDVINGRQFDVAMRFCRDAIRYLVLIEVKNRSRKASAGDLDAFVTKARDQAADRAVLVTAAGFQKGAVTVAKRHGIELFTVKFDHANACLPPDGSYAVLNKEKGRRPVTPEFRMGEPTLVTQIQSITLVYGDGRRFDVPGEATQMTYYASKTRIGKSDLLVDLIEKNAPNNLDLGEVKSFRVSFLLPRNVSPPDSHFFPAGKLKAIEAVAMGCLGRPIQGHAKIEPSALQSPVVYTNALTGEKTRFEMAQLPLGVEIAQVGKFYFMSGPLRYFYCSGIENGLATWDMIESFQNAQLIRMRYEQDVRFSKHYIPITDRSILKRLQVRLKEYQALQESNA